MCDEAREMYLRIAKDTGIFVPSELRILDDDLVIFHKEIFSPAYRPAPLMETVPAMA